MPQYSSPNTLYDQAILYNGQTPLTQEQIDTALDLRRNVSLSGTMVESSNYQFLGLGLTDRIFLLGHAGGVGINTPFQVLDMIEARDALLNDPNSPLLAAMLQTYKAGARDMWIMCVAPMEEYVILQSDRLLPSSSLSGRTVAEIRTIDPNYTFPSTYSTNQWNDLNFYQRYNARLNEAYDILEEFDSPQIIVPIEANFYDSGNTDFVTSLARHCGRSFEKTGAIRLGMLGSKLNAVNSYFTETDYQNVIDSAIIPWQGDNGKFVSLFLGEGTVSFRENATTMSLSPVHIIAGMMSQLKINDSIIYRQLPNVINLSGKTLSQTQLKTLTEMGVNCLVQTNIGKRGRPFQVVPGTDNTLTQFGSDFWSIAHMRLMMLVIERLRSLGRRYLGSIGYESFKHDVQQFFDTLTHELMIRDYTLNITRSEDKLTANVDVGIRPYFGIRSIYFSTEVGPQS